jgi:hypothetical protein
MRVFVASLAAAEASSQDEYSGFLKLSRKIPLLIPNKLTWEQFLTQQGRLAGGDRPMIQVCFRDTS